MLVLVLVLLQHPRTGRHVMELYLCDGIVYAIDDTSTTRALRASNGEELWRSRHRWGSGCARGGGVSGSGSGSSSSRRRSVWEREANWTERQQQPLVAIDLGDADDDSGLVPAAVASATAQGSAAPVAAAAPRTPARVSTPTAAAAAAAASSTEAGSSPPFASPTSPDRDREHHHHHEHHHGTANDNSNSNANEQEEEEQGYEVEQTPLSTHEAAAVTSKGKMASAEQHHLFSGGVEAPHIGTIYLTAVSLISNQFINLAISRVGFSASTPGRDWDLPYDSEIWPGF